VGKFVVAVEPLSVLPVAAGELVVSDAGELVVSEAGAFRPVPVSGELAVAPVLDAVVPVLSGVVSALAVAADSVRFRTMSVWNVAWTASFDAVLPVAELPAGGLAGAVLDGAVLAGAASLRVNDVVVSPDAVTR
jgi:hypothetical protein